MALKLYNSLTRKQEEFRPIEGKSKVGMYTCGPTVYSYVHIGNWRTYVVGDLILRSLKFLGYKVDYVMNVTDVGHLTGDNLGDADIGEDKLEVASKKEGKTAWDISRFYTQDFLEGFESMNLLEPKLFSRATDHIKEQISLIKTIIAKGFSYQTKDGIYFDTKKYEAAGNMYGQLSSLDKIKEGARVAKNLNKKDPRDFALWKFSRDYSADAENLPYPNRQMNWFFDGPKTAELVSKKNLDLLKQKPNKKNNWFARIGFPGWHIECSAMSMKYLGEQFELHVGGEDLLSTHHPNEIAQSEAATGKKPFVKYWLHGAFLQVDGGKMSKSKGTAYTLHDLNKKGFAPLDLRYFYLTAHFRKPLNFTWPALAAAKTARLRLVSQVADLLKSVTGKEVHSKIGREIEAKFKKYIEDNFNIPQALALVWELLRNDQVSADEKMFLIDRFDQVLGLDLILAAYEAKDKQIPSQVIRLAKQRDKLREEKKWQEADKIRKEIENKGFVVKDTEQGTVIS